MKTATFGECDWPYPPIPAHYGSAVHVPSYAAFTCLVYIYARMNSIEDPLHVVGEIASQQPKVINEFPCDGLALYIPGDGKDVKPKYRYTEGPGDRAWMEAQDRIYLIKLAVSANPARQLRFLSEMTSLNLSLTHHQKLRREFAPHLDWMIQLAATSRIARIPLRARRVRMPIRPIPLRPVAESKTSKSERAVPKH